MPDIVEIALRYEGCDACLYEGPNSGNTPESGFDCSGFIQYVLQQADLPLPTVPEDAFLVDTDREETPSPPRPVGHSEEFFDRYGILIHEEARQRGDLIFFSEGERPKHLGILIDEDEMIHSPGIDDTEVGRLHVPSYVDSLRIEPSDKQIYHRNPIGYKRPAIPDGRYQKPLQAGKFTEDMLP